MKRTQIVVSGYQWNQVWQYAIRRVDDELAAGGWSDFDAIRIKNLLCDVREKLEEADS